MQDKVVALVTAWLKARGWYRPLTAEDAELLFDYKLHNGS